MTEDEAKTKWCPFARAPHLLNEYDAAPDLGERIQRGSQRAFAVNRVNGGAWPTAANCIGSACMAWRWRVMPVAGQRGGSVAVKVEPGRFAAKPYSPTPEVVGDGFCGLAGSPQ